MTPTILITGSEGNTGAYLQKSVRAAHSDARVFRVTRKTECSAHPDLYRGDISQLSGTSIAATAQSRSGTRISLAMHLTIDDANNVGGTASAVLGGSRGN